MTRPGRAARAEGLVTGLALALAGCASPPTQFFTLTATPGTALAGGPRTVMLRRPGIAGYLDRPEIVRDSGNHQLKLAANQQWGEPFGSMLGRILVEDLNRRLPGTSVYGESGAISADPELTLEVDIQRFDADPGGPVVLAVQWSVEHGRGNPSGPPVNDRVTVTPASASTADLAAAMSTALGQEADVIATAIRSQGVAGTSRTEAPAARGRRTGR